MHSLYSFGNTWSDPCQKNGKTKTSKKGLNMDRFKVVKLYVNRWMYKGNHSARVIALQSCELWEKRITEVPQMIGVSSHLKLLPTVGSAEIRVLKSHRTNSWKRWNFPGSWTTRWPGDLVFLWTRVANLPCGFTVSYLLTPHDMVLSIVGWRGGGCKTIHWPYSCTSWKGPKAEKLRRPSSEERETYFNSTCLLLLIIYFYYYFNICLNICMWCWWTCLRDIVLLGNQLVNYFFCS